MTAVETITRPYTASGVARRLRRLLPSTDGRSLLAGFALALATVTVGLLSMWLVLSGIGALDRAIQGPYGRELWSIPVLLSMLCLGFGVAVVAALSPTMVARIRWPRQAGPRVLRTAAWMLSLLITAAAMAFSDLGPGDGTLWFRVKQCAAVLVLGGLPLAWMYCALVSSPTREYRHDWPGNVIAMMIYPVRAMLVLTFVGVVIFTLFAG